MSRTQDLDPVKAALDKFLDHRLAALARKVVHRLQRLRDPGGHPYGWPMGSLWNLYSWDVQNGPIGNTGLLEDLVRDAAVQVIRGLAGPEAILLAQLVSEDDLPPDTRSDWEVAEALMERVSDLAGRRNLERFDPDHRWYEDR